MPPPPPAKVAGRKELNPLVLADQADKELAAQRDFAAKWGALVPDLPATQDAVLERKRAELAALAASSGVVPGGAFSSVSATAYAQREDLEKGLAKAYKSLKAGT
jgi:hypothetical protein